MSCATERIFDALSCRNSAPEQLMIDATYLKAHRTAASLRKKGGRPRRISRTKGGLNSKLPMACDQNGRPLALELTDGATADITVAKRVLRFLPKAEAFLADKAYSASHLI